MCLILYSNAKAWRLEFADTTGLLKKYRHCTANSPPLEGWQAQPDGVVSYLLKNTPCRRGRLVAGIGVLETSQLKNTPCRRGRLICLPVICCVSIQYCLPFDSGKPCGGSWRLRWYKYNTFSTAPYDCFYISYSYFDALQIIYSQIRLEFLMSIDSNATIKRNAK